jgi:hypothetical protein
LPSDHELVQRAPQLFEPARMGARDQSARLVREPIPEPAQTPPKVRAVRTFMAGHPRDGLVAHVREGDVFPFDLLVVLLHSNCFVPIDEQDERGTQ